MFPPSLGAYRPSVAGAGVPTQKLINAANATDFRLVVVAHLLMITFLAAMASLLSFRLRSRVSLEHEVI
jgi:hypothetical protein